MSIIDTDIDSYYPHSTAVLKKEEPFTRVDEGIVDGELYICVSTRTGSEVDHWLAKHGAIRTSAGWAFHSYFDVPEKLYMLLLLSF